MNAFNNLKKLLSEVPNHISKKSISMDRNPFPTSPLIWGASGWLGPLTNNECVLVNLNYFLRYMEDKSLKTIFTMTLVRYEDIFCRLLCTYEQIVDISTLARSSLTTARREALNKLEPHRIDRKQAGKLKAWTEPLYGTCEKALDSGERDKGIIEKCKGKHLADKRRGAN